MISVCVRFPDGSQDGFMIKELFCDKKTLTVVTSDGKLRIYELKEVKNFELVEIKEKGFEEYRKAMQGEDNENRN